MLNEPVKKTVEEMFLQYLKLVKLDVNEISDVQLIETRRAFYGAVGMVLVLIMEQGEKKRSQKELTDLLNNIRTEVWKFWKFEGSDKNIFSK